MFTLPSFVFFFYDFLALIIVPANPQGVYLSRFYKRLTPEFRRDDAPLVGTMIKADFLHAD
jgi:hypothetical protein